MTHVRLPGVRPPHPAATGLPGREDWARACRHPVVISMAVTAAGAIVWMVFFPRTGTDISAAIARAGWAGHYPAAGYLFSWYGGFYPATYSVLAPYLLAVTGVWTGMALAAVSSAGLLTAMLVKHGAPRPRAAALWVAAALCAGLLAGRAAFTLGTAVALGCVAMAGSGRSLRWPRLLAVAALALLASLLSPVAGLFLGVPAAAFVLTGRRRCGLAIGLAVAVPLALAALPLHSDAQPIGVLDVVPSLLAAVLVICLVPRRWQILRIGAAICAAAVLASWALPTPVGSNVDRLGELLAGPVLAGLGSARFRRLLLLTLIGAGAWQAAQPSLDLLHGNAPPYAPQTAALARELQALGADKSRVEAVPQYGHWEAQQLAGTVWLARGWERQLDTACNPLFYQGRLTAARYRRWLRANAVGYVALSSGAPDWAASREAALVRQHPSWLVPIWHNATWRLYRVTGTLPLASPPARVVATTPARIVLRMRRAGTTIVRVRWSPLLRAVGGRAHLASGGGWTSLTVARAGRYTITAPY